MMKIEIFDVGHGHCSMITTPNGRKIMLDCGTLWLEEKFWTPSLHFFGEEIDVLALLNLDKDHIDDFGNVLKHCRVRSILTNPTVGLSEFTKLKNGDVAAKGLSDYAEWLGQPKLSSDPAQFWFGGVVVRWYNNPYISDVSKGTNDLSLLVVVQYGTFKMVFAGDLEVSGWKNILNNPSVYHDIQDASIFVASHHGRKNGCFDVLFDNIKPEIFVISDDSLKYDSQDTGDYYSSRCRGATYIADPTKRRYVMTTRKDGSMRITADHDGRWALNPFKVQSWPIKCTQNFNNLLGVDSFATTQ